MKTAPTPSKPNLNDMICVVAGETEHLQGSINLLRANDADEQTIREVERRHAVFGATHEFLLMIDDHKSAVQVAINASKKRGAK